jgi:hypothetical protein
MCKLKLVWTVSCLSYEFVHFKVKICNGPACDKTLTCPYCSHCRYRKKLFCCYLLHAEFEWSMTLYCAHCNGSPATLHMFCVVCVTVDHLQHCTCSVLCASQWITRNMAHTLCGARHNGLPATLHMPENVWPDSSLLQVDQLSGIPECTISKFKMASLTRCKYLHPLCTLTLCLLG